MYLTEKQRESIENIIRGAMLPVATGGFPAIDVHAPGATNAIVSMLGRDESAAS